MSKEAYETFCNNWDIEDTKTVQKLYDIDQLKAFLPEYPSVSQREALKEVIGASFDQFYGYIDYQKSTNTFELIMQWREKTGEFGN